MGEARASPAPPLSTDRGSSLPLSVTVSIHDQPSLIISSSAFLSGGLERPGLRGTTTGALLGARVVDDAALSARKCP